MGRSRAGLILMAVVLVAATLTAVTWESTAAHASSIPITTITLKQAHAYTPKAPAVATDDYHCTLMDPHVSRSSYIISS
jgi:hypothetical protein